MMALLGLYLMRGTDTMNKRKIFTFFTAILSVLVLMNMHIHITYAADPPEIKAKAAIVIDATTGKILYSKDAEQQHYPASTTKMMSLIVALENSNLEDKVVASNRSANTEGSSLSLTQGESLKMIDLLYGMMLISGNDATVAVAEHVAGSVENFAALMTKKAHDIGAMDTQFVNSSGLPDPRHYTTAHDLARIAAYGYKNPLFREIVGTKHKTIPWVGKEFDRDLYNENRMLWLYEGGNGVKTGYTELAGRCLVSGAMRNGIQLVCVVLDSDTMWDDSIALLNFSFPQVTPEKLFQKNDILKTISVMNGTESSVKLLTSTDVIIPVFEEGKEQFKTVIDAPDRVNAPIIAGQKIGVLRIFYQNKEIISSDLLADVSIEKKSFFHTLGNYIYSVFDFLTKQPVDKNKQGDFPALSLS